MHKFNDWTKAQPYPTRAGRSPRFARDDRNRSLQGAHQGDAAVCSILLHINTISLLLRLKKTW